MDTASYGRRRMGVCDLGILIFREMTDMSEWSAVTKADEIMIHDKVCES